MARRKAHLFSAGQSRDGWLPEFRAHPLHLTLRPYEIYWAEVTK
jgi:hypothetical protein